MASPVPSHGVPRRRRFRWSLKWFLILAAAVPALCGPYLKRVFDRQSVLDELAAAAPQSTHALVEYDFEFDDEGHPLPNARSSVPRLLLGTFGHSFFHDIVGVNLDGEHAAIADLQAIRSLSKLKRLDVEYNTVSQEFLQTIGSLSALERLDLQETGIHDDDLRHVSALKNLRILLLSGQGISDDGLKHLRAMRQLEAIALRDCTITGSGLIHLVQSRSLNSLDLRRSPISDDSIESICGFQALQTLNLSNTQVSDTGVKKLAVLRNLSKLKVPAGISDETISLLREQMPKCKVETDQF